MKYTIKKEKWQRVVLDNVEVDIPEETLYFWHSGVRRAYSVKPELTTWLQDTQNKLEEIWQLHVVMVDPSDVIISYHCIRTSEIANILADSKHSLQRLVADILEPDGYSKRTKEEFMNDYNTIIDRLSEML